MSFLQIEATDSGQRLRLFRTADNKRIKLTFLRINAPKLGRLSALNPFHHRMRVVEQQSWELTIAESIAPLNVYAEA
jgi:hypothetical protein